jgi:hypothetical protein
MSPGMKTGDRSIDAPEDAALLRAVSDLRGLHVEDASGLSAGTVYGSLVEAETGLVRYVDLALATLDRHVLVPIGHARIREKQGEKPKIRLRAAMLEELELIPPFPPDVDLVDDPFERALLEAYGRTFHGERYYAHPAYDHAGVFAGEHPVVGADFDAGDPGLRRLAYLPGWRVAEGEPDIRGWPLVLGRNGRLEIRDLIVDPAAQQVRYVVFTSEDGDMARLLPLGYLTIDRAAREVHADGLAASDVADLPPYDGGGVSREQEERLTAALRRALSGRRRYALPDYRTGAGT